ncbi:LOW QUALITY PROTEIN: protein lin-54 homolog [Drosophila gunungcola]|uniref:LOW QUALITY PROTEIN: protein lin-54 homolog n=1 Tax=Drosophila gunungcola TaxID=103775 RepID=UPI0022E4FB6B|nr:LOW QUALITY PROTEIN: protein lin-54 homolog [Drosophila gunungcola]
MDTSGGNLDSLDDTEPLPELSFEDFLEPTSDKSSQHMEIDALDSDVDDVDEDEAVDPANDSLNTPQFKRNVVHIVEDKRLPTSGGAVLKSHAIKVVTAGGTSPAKPQIKDLKILNNLKPITSNTLKIGSTTIATTSTPGTITKTLSNLTQIKTQDGRVIFVQKAVPATQTKTPVAGSPGGGIRRLVAPAAIQKAVLAKGVALANTGLVKAAVPGKAVTSGTTGSSGSASTSTTFTIKGITPLAGGSAKVTSPVTSPTCQTAVQHTKIQVVRTADGKIIKINQAGPSLLLNAKQSAVGTSATSGSSAVKLSPSTGSVVLGKSVGPVLLKSATPVKQAATATSTPTTATPGKMLVQSGGKQILVSSKNIIKLSPKAGATSTITNTAGGQTASPTSELHAIQLPGKAGVQYVRVLTNTKSAVGPSASVAVPKTMPTQKITVVRTPAGTSAATSKPATSTATPAVTGPASAVPKATPSMGNTNKIVMRTMGGSIVPLPSMQTLVSKRALGASTNASKPASVTNTNTNSSSSGSPSGNQESPRKSRLTDLNQQLKHLASASSDASDSSDAGPEAKKPRYVITMQQGTQQTTQATQKLIGRQTNVQRVAVASSPSSSAPKKIYNFVKSTGTNGVKYMICNSGVPQSSTSAMRRGYTGYVDNKLRRTLSISSQQHRFKQLNPQQQTKHMQLQAQAKQRIRQQQLQSVAIKVEPTLPVQPPIQKPTVPAKPLFDILKPAAAGAAATVDALGGMTSRRKHCNCSKSQCLKLYCDCFANGEFCQDCSCKDCFNNLDYEVERERAIRSCLDRNPSAFKPKITAPNSGDMRLHNKGCNCKRSGCLKNYCECYEAKIPCTSICKCVGCRNMEDRPDVDMDSLDGLMGAKGPKADKTNDKHTYENRANLYLTDDVIEATIMCMISRIVMHEKQNMPVEDTEREVMEELGESLNQIITFAKDKHDTSQLDESKAAS